MYSHMNFPIILDKQIQQEVVWDILGYKNCCFLEKIEYTNLE
jgi:hypothetical protein